MAQGNIYLDVDECEKTDIFERMRVELSLLGLYTIEQEWCVQT